MSIRQMKPMSVALPTSVLRAAREDTTEAPSMPTKHHIMMIMQLKPTPPSGAASGPYCPAATALSYTLPQKSAVKMPALNRKMPKMRVTAMAATLHTMTMAFRKAALSTPRMTR